MGSWRPIWASWLQARGPERSLLVILVGVHPCWCVGLESQSCPWEKALGSRPVHILVLHYRMGLGEDRVGHPAMCARWHPGHVGWVECPRCQPCVCGAALHRELFVWPRARPSAGCPGRRHSGTQGSLLCCRRQPFPAVGAPVHDLEAAAAPRQALSHSPAQHLGAEHPPGLSLRCLATHPLGTMGVAGSLVRATEDMHLMLDISRCWLP